MVQKYITVRVSDLSGAELQPEEGETITFAVGRSNYVIDLSDDEVGQFYDALKPFTEAARKGEAVPARSGAAAGPKADKRSDLAEIRTWANDNGFAVSGRGRISANVLDAYDAAH